MTVTPTTAELNYAHSWIGTDEANDVFGERFDRLYTALGVNAIWTTDLLRRQKALGNAIVASLRAQLAVMTLDQPSAASAEGNSYSNVQNIVALQKTINDFLSGAGGSASGSGVGTFLRTYRRTGR